MPTKKSADREPMTVNMAREVVAWRVHAVVTERADYRELVGRRELPLLNDSEFEAVVARAKQLGEHHRGSDAVYWKAYGVLTAQAGEPS